MTAIFFHTMLPLSIPIGAVGIFLHYWSNKVSTSSLYKVLADRLCSWEEIECQIKCQAWWLSSSPTWSLILLSCGLLTRSLYSVASIAMFSISLTWSRSSLLSQELVLQSYSLSSLWEPWSTTAFRITEQRPTRPMTKSWMILSLITILKIPSQRTRACLERWRRDSPHQISVRKRRRIFNSRCRLFSKDPLYKRSHSIQCKSRPCILKCSRWPLQESWLSKCQWWWEVSRWQLPAVTVLFMGKLNTVACKWHHMEDMPKLIMLIHMAMGRLKLTAVLTEVQHMVLSMVYSKLLMEVVMHKLQLCLLTW